MSGDVHFKKRAITLAVLEGIKTSFGEAALPPPKPAPKSEPAPHPQEPLAPGDELFELVEHIVRAYYSIDDPTPGAPAGAKMLPLSCTQLGRDDTLKVSYFPYPPDAFNPATNQIDTKKLDAKMDSELVRLFDHLEAVEGEGIHLEIDRKAREYKILAQDVFALLALFEDLTYAHSYPTFDNIYYGSSLGRKARTEDGTRCFDSRRQFKDYMKECVFTAGDGTQGLAAKDPDAFLGNMPPVPFQDFAEAERIRSQYIKLAKDTPLIPYSFARLENRLKRLLDPKYKSFDDLPGLLLVH